MYIFLLATVWGLRLTPPILPLWNPHYTTALHHVLVISSFKCVCSLVSRLHMENILRNDVQTIKKNMIISWFNDFYCPLMIR